MRVVFVVIAVYIKMIFQGNILFYDGIDADVEMVHVIVGDGQEQFRGRDEVTLNAGHY